MKTVDNQSSFMQEHLVPISENQAQMQELLDKVGSEFPEHDEQISVCLSRIAKVDKKVTHTAEHQRSMNKLLNALFSEKHESDTKEHELQLLLD